MKIPHYCKISLRYLVLTFLVLVTCPTVHAQTTTYYVDSAHGNDAYMGTSWATAFRNVTKAMAVANASTSPEIDIWIARGTYKPVEGIGSLPTDIRDTSFTFYRGNGIGKALKVYGGFAGTETSITMRDTNNRTYLDGNVGGGLKCYHVVVIAGLAQMADSLVLDGLTIRNGFARDSLTKVFNGITVNRNFGGGINICNDSSASFAIRNCTIQSDSAIGSLIHSTFGFLTGAACYGGGIYNYRSSAFFSNCRFYFNSVVGGTPGAGLYISGGGAYGGGICNLYSSSVFSECNFRFNNVTGGGDPVYSGHGGEAGGGGICNISSDCRLTACNFSMNKIVGGGADNWTILGTFAGASLGGALYNSASTTILRHCTFTANMAYSNSAYIHAGAFGGGICNRSSSICSLDTCSFTNNCAKDMYYAFGGAMYNDSSIITQTGCLYIADSAVGAYPFGGAISDAHSSSTYNFCNFDSNVVRYFYYITDSARGGAIANHLSSPVFKSCNFVANYAYGLGGSPTFGGAVYNSHSLPAFLKCNFIANRDSSLSYSYGGAMYNLYSNAIIDSCSFRSNLAYAVYQDGRGGAIYNSLYCSPRISHCQFSDNKASSLTGSSNGGAIYHADSRLSITRCVFKADSANYGGAVFLEYSYYATGLLVPSSLYGDHNVFTANVSKYGGGAINLLMLGGTDTLTNNLFIKNKDLGTNGGGSLTMYGDDHFIANNTFYKDSVAPGGHGGAMIFTGTGGHSIIANNVFYDNYGQSASSDTGLSIGNTYYFSHNLFSTTNPLFMDAANPIGPDSAWGTADDGLHLQKCSAGRNTASDSFVIAAELTDLADAGRIEGGIIDMGAYESYPVSPVIGAHDICVGGTLLLSDTTSGGIWVTSDSTIALINSSGLVTGVSQGMDTVLYIVISTCGTDTAFMPVHVTSATEAGIIVGPDGVCSGHTITLTDSISGGAWAATNGNAMVLGGLVMGITAGTDTIVYTNNCGLGHVYKIVTINPSPVVGIISGADSLCTGSVIVLADTTTDGVWASGSSNISVSDSMVSGVLPGTATVYYSKSNSLGCVTTMVKNLIIRAMPDAGTISGADSICVGSTHVWTGSVPGGVWTNMSSATVTISSFGYLTAVSPGPDTITYIQTNMCGTAEVSAQLFVDQPVSPLVGADTLCVGATVLLYDSTYGGTWSSTDSTIAAVDSAGLVHGATQGVALITYSLINACGLSNAAMSVFIERTASAIVSDDSVCVANGISLQDSTVSGIWTCSNTAIASIAGSNIYGVSSGECIVNYTVNNHCGTSIATQTFTVLSTGFCDTLLAVDAENSIVDIGISPNPANQLVRVSAPVKIYMSIFTIDGRLIKTIFNPSEVDISDLISGVYLLIIHDVDGRKLKTSKLVVSH